MGAIYFAEETLILYFGSCLRESSAATSEHGSDLAHRKMMVDETFKEADKVALGQLVI